MRNIHKRRTFIDKFARRYYCQNSRLRQLRSDKREAKRAERRHRKAECALLDWVFLKVIANRTTS